MELEAVLLDAGAEVAGLCRSVDEALRIVKAGGVDVAILDFGLGKETAAPIADRLKTDDTPFCFYTGQVATDPRLHPWSGCAILQKPSLPRAIVQAVAILARSRLVRKL